MRTSLLKMFARIAIGRLWEVDQKFALSIKSHYIFFTKHHVEKFCWAFIYKLAIQTRTKWLDLNLSPKKNFLPLFRQINLKFIKTTMISISILFTAKEGWGSLNWTAGHCLCTRAFWKSIRRTHKYLCLCNLEEAIWE